MQNGFDKIGPVSLWANGVSPQIGTIFVARATLRTVPLLSGLIGHPELEKPRISAIIYPLWLISLIHSSGMRSFLDLPIKVAAEKTFKTGQHFSGYSGSNVAAGSAGRCAFTAYDAAKAILELGVERAGSIGMTAMRIASSFSDDVEIHSQHFWDAQFVKMGGSANVLAVQPLWNGNSKINNFPVKLEQDWQILKQFLIDLNQGWEVWIDWYEARLRGESLIEEIEIGDPENGQYGRVTLPVDYYNDPAKANAAIKEIIESYWAKQNLLDQDVTAETFGLNDEGQITRTTIQTSSELTDTPEQRDWYNSLRQAALGMREIGDNALGRAARPVNNVLEALPEDITEAKVALLWPAANRIRKLKSAHDRAIDSGDEYHPNSLAAEVVDDIDQFVDVYNNLVIGDTSLSDKDKTAKGPQDEKTEIEASENAALAIEVAIEHDMFTDDAQEIIQVDIAEEREIIAKIEANTDLSVLEKLARDNTQVAKENAIRAIIIRVRESEKYGLIEKGALAGIGYKIVEFAGSIWPALVSSIKAIFGFL